MQNIAADPKHPTQTCHAPSRTLLPPDTPLLILSLAALGFGCAACSETHFGGGGVVEHL